MKFSFLIFAFALVMPALIARETVPLFIGITKEGHAHVDMALIEVTTLPDQTTRLVAQGSYHGKIAEFELVLGGNWAQLASGTMYSTPVQLVARGDRSQVFAEAMAEALDRTPLEGSGSKREMTGVLLTGKPKSIFTTPCWLQLIHGALPSEDYTELYAYIDLPGRRLRLREGDKRFRDSLLRLLAGSNPPPEPKK